MKISTNQSDMKRAMADYSKTSKLISKEITMVVEVLDLSPISSIDWVPGGGQPRWKGNQF